MTRNKQNEGAGRETAGPNGKSGIGHWVRLAVCVLSGGFVFPHAFTENMESTEYETDKEARLGKP